MLVATATGELDAPGGAVVELDETLEGGAGGCVGEGVQGGASGVDGEVHEPMVGVCEGVGGAARLAIGAGGLGL